MGRDLLAFERRSDLFGNIDDLVMKRSIASRLSRPPRMLGKTGSGRESVETFGLRGFISCVQFDSSSRRRCGNVETRVLCGFPSSEGGQNRCGRRSIIPPSERHFHSEAPVYRPFWRECVVWAAGGAK
jgi:hypothetical protein